MNMEKVNRAIELLKEVGEKDSITNTDGFMYDSWYHMIRERDSTITISYNTENYTLAIYASTPKFACLNVELDNFTLNTFIELMEETKMMKEGK
jgi:hypothetical protein